MAHGLDIGPSAIRSAGGAADEPAITAVPPIAVPVDESTLESIDVSNLDLRTVDVDDTTYAVGADADTVADAADDEPRTPLADGTLTAEKASTLAPILEAALDLDAELESADETRLCYAMPGPLEDREGIAETYRDAVESVAADRNVELELTAIDRGFAVVYDQLSEDNYTGLGICLGSRTTSVALVYYGVPALSFALPIGSEWVRDRAAADGGASSEAVADVHETFELDPDAEGEIERALAQAYDALIGDVLETLAERADAASVQDGVSVPIAVGGAGAVEGVEYLVAGRFDAAPLPFSIRGARLADEPAASAARGARAAAVDGVDGTVTWTGPETSADASTGTNATLRTGNGAAATADALETDGIGESTLSFDAVDAAAADAERTDRAIEQLFDRLADRDDEIRAIRDDLEAVRETQTELRGEYDDRLAETASATALEEVDADLAALADDVGALEGALETLSDRADDFADRSALEDLETDLESLEVRFDETVERLEDRLDELSTGLEERSARIDRVESSLESDLETVESELGAELETVENGLETDLETLSDRVEAAASEGAVADLAADVATLERRLEDVRAEHVELRETYDDRLAETASAATVDDVSDRLAEVTDAVGSLEADLETLSDRADGAADRDALEALRDDLESVETRLEELSAESDARESRLDGVSGRLEELSTRIDALSERLDDRSERIDALESDLGSDLETVEASLNATLESVTERTDELADDVEQLAGDVEAVDERTDANPDRFERLDERVDDAERTLEGLVDRVDSIADRVDSGTERSLPAGDEGTDLEQRLEALESELAETPSPAATATRDDVDALRSDLEDVRIRLRTDSDGDVDTDDGAASNSNPNAALVPSIAGGGGSAGIVAGAVGALVGAEAIGAAAIVAGLLLLGGAVVSVRGE